MSQDLHQQLLTMAGSIEDKAKLQLLLQDVEGYLADLAEEKDETQDEEEEE